MPYSSEWRPQSTPPPYACDKKVCKHVELDRKRAVAGIPEHQPGYPYNPIKAQGMFEVASYFVPEFKVLAAKLADALEDSIPNWSSLVLDCARDPVEE